VRPLPSWLGRGVRRPAIRRLLSAHPRVNRLEDRTVPAGTAFFPPSYYLANPAFTAPPGTLTQPRASVNVSAAEMNSALSFLRDHAGQLGLSPDDLTNPFVTSQYADADTGIAHVYLQQQVNGLPVVNADFTVGIASNDQVISAGGGFVTGLQGKLGDTGTPWPGMIAADAVRAAAADLGLTLSAEPAYVDAFMGPVGRPLTSFTISAPGVSLDPIPAELVYAPTPDGGAAEAWELTVRTPGGQHWYDLSVDAASGAILSQADWVDNDNYNVIPPPNENPQDGGGFSVVSNPADPVASPYGWEDTNGVAGPEFTDTRGNNVDAHLDVNADDVPDPSPGRPSGGANLDFSGYTLNPTLTPSAVQNQYAAQANLFYINNLLHDVHYQYGFTEAAGNFQVNDYGRGGLGNDPVQADAQDGSGTNNANFSTPTDGSSPRMQMYTWTYTSPGRDGDFDNSVIIHEYGHGVSTRLTGGPANSNALNAIQSGGMGEGWSDFYALMFLQRPTDTANSAYPVATYVVGQSSTGAGIRRRPYSFNMTTDPLMFDAYGTSGTTSYGISRSTEVHNTGELWTSALWDMNWLLVAKYGFDANLATGWSPNLGPAHAGNKLALRLVMDGLKLQPANPSFTQARDAIISADVALNGGADLYEIWSAFARRGLGQGSSSGASSSTTTPTISTALPMLIQSVTPAAGAIVGADPASYIVTVTAPIDPATLDATDLTVNGQPATGVSYTPGSNSATFTFATDPVTGSGPQTIGITAGAFARASDESAIPAYTSSFYISTLAVTSVTPAAGAAIAPPLTTIDVNLNAPIDPASVQNSDLTIGRGIVTGFNLLNGNSTVRFTVANLTAEQSLTVAVASGAFTDLQGNPSAGFDDGTLYVDNTIQPFPTPLRSAGPAGSLVYGGSVSGNVGYAGDTDGFTLTLDAGQTLSLAVTPDAVLRPTITVTGPGTNASASAAAAGATARLNTLAVTTAGTYTVTVGGAGSTIGNYAVQATLNQAQEAESVGGAANDATGTAQSLAGAFADLGVGLAVATVHGRSDVSGVINETEPNGSTATATPAGLYSVAPAGNLYQLGIAGSLNTTTDGDYINIGGMQSGDVLTISESASGAGRGTGSDPYVYLYRAGSPTPVASDDDSGPGTDSLIYRYTITTADTYYVRAYRFSTSTTTGTYQLGVLLENSGAVPGTGSILTAEVEPNDTIAQANDASSAWRPVGDTATAVGTIASGDTDIYSYQFTAGDVVTMIAHSTSGLSPTAALLNSSGTVLASDNGGSNVGGTGGQAPLFGYVIPATGTYYFRVTAASGIGSYTADVSLSTTASVTTAPPGQDLYSFNLSAGQSASAVLKTAAPGNLHVAILDGSGTVIASGAGGTTNVDEEVGNFVAPAAGTYYLRVTGPANVDYQATVVTGGTFDAEPNDSFATAQPLTAGTSALGAIGSSDDWYQINLAAGTSLTLSTTIPGGGPGEFTNTLDPQIDLFDPNGNLIASDDNSAADGRNATLTRTTTIAGNYRVHVGGTLTIGEYTLNTSVANVTPAPQVGAVVVGDGSDQRSEVRSIAVTFTQPVGFAGGDANAAAAFQLQHVQTGANVALSTAVTTNGLGQTVVTLTFSGSETDPISAFNGGAASLADGRYALTIFAANVTGAGGALAGGQPNGDYVSPPDSYQGAGPHLYRIFGDANGDGAVDAIDLGQFRSTFNAATGNPLYLSFLDADNSGAVDAQDLGQLRSRFNSNVF
jgi:extracellular elastinolytic metalloproteinase